MGDENERDESKHVKEAFILNTLSPFLHLTINWNFQMAAFYSCLNHRTVIIYER